MKEQAARLELEDPYVAAFPESLPFWTAARRGVLVLPRCEDCGKSHWFPRAHCPFCHGARVKWQESDGRGTVYSWTLLRKKDAPYVVAYVELKEGPIMLTNIVDCANAEVAIGMPVHVKFRAAPEGRLVPVFVPGS